MPRIRQPGHPSILQLTTTWGTIHVTAVRGRVVGCALPKRDRGGCPLRVTRSEIHAGDRADREVLAASKRFVEACLAGRRAPMPRIALPAGTDFDRSVWTILRRLKAGSTLTYGELAAAAGRAKAARAAGAACGRNPLPLFVPCHRVTGAGGRLGGFSSGLAWKRLLLSAEGALP